MKFSVWDFSNKKEDWIGIFLYCLMFPFVVVIGSVMFAATLFCVAVYVAMEFAFKAFKYFVDNVKGN